ncbi:glycerophosphodiester phosphodiesterase family protein [Shimia gijangensis]|nr:glycerophosphodiester phosphodiesterase family protein [Shimia gijangensis]
MTVIEAYGLAWRLRRSFFISHLVFNLLLTAFVAPFMAGVMRLVLALSGQPALSDFDIAYFVFSPVGFVALLLVLGLFLTLYVLNAAFMMAIALRNKTTGEHGFADGFVSVLPRVPAIVQFAVFFTLRVMAILLPFVTVSGGLFWVFLTSYDINYYLQNKPPEFLIVGSVIVCLLAFAAVLLLRHLLSWALALPMVIFANMSPQNSFGASKAAMLGRRMSLLKKILTWGIGSGIALAVLFGAFGLVADRVLEAFGSDLRVLAKVLLVFASGWALLNLAATSLTTGALAVLLIDKAGWPDRKVRAPSTTALRRVRLSIGIAALVGFVSGGLALIDFARMKVPDQVEVIAHRGAAGVRPENTMASIEKAIEDGADWVEIDVQETGDGQVIVIHDSDFMKIGGDPVKVWDATMQDVARIDIGSWFDPVYADQRAPLLSEVLLAAKGHAGVLIELKYYGHDVMLEQRVSDIVTATGMDAHVMSMSLKYPAVQKMKAIRPDWPSGLLSSASAGRIWQLEADFVAVNKASATPRLVREMRKAGKKLYVWTVNEPLEMSHMLSMGVDGLITDEPAMARNVISQRHELTTPERAVLALANKIGVALDTKEYRDESP